MIPEREPKAEINESRYNKQGIQLIWVLIRERGDGEKILTQSLEERFGIVFSRSVANE